MSSDQFAGAAGRGVDSKVERLVTYCLYLIATGKWRAGIKLPSIRQGEELWNLNRITVQRAYKRLEEMGLIQVRTKSGYFVTREADVDRISRHRFELQNFFMSVHDRVRTEMDLSPLGVFRYMAEMAELFTAEHPEVAFAECTRIQAEGHAAEITSRFNIPVMPLTVSEISGKRSRVPSHVRTLFTTYFHISEFQEIKGAGGLAIFAVPIEVSPELKQAVSEVCGKVIFLEREDVQAAHIGQDSSGILSELDLETRVVKDVEPSLARILAENPEGLILLSPRLWGSISDTWRNHSSVRPVQFRICPDAFQALAEQAGLPLGDVS